MDQEQGGSAQELLDPSCCSGPQKEESRLFRREPVFTASLSTQPDGRSSEWVLFTAPSPDPSTVPGTGLPHVVVYINSSLENTIGFFFALLF